MSQLTPWTGKPPSGTGRELQRLQSPDLDLPRGLAALSLVGIAAFGLTALLQNTAFRGLAFPSLNRLRAAKPRPERGRELDDPIVVITQSISVTLLARTRRPTAEPSPSRALSVGRATQLIRSLL
jgi:hypothetical protein